eukprot:7886169-Pyramimonas_sp.AAC.1
MAPSFETHASNIQISATAITDHRNTPHPSSKHHRSLHGLPSPTSMREAMCVPCFPEDGCATACGLPPLIHRLPC